MRVSQLLQYARAILENPERWIKLSNARDASGVDVDWTSVFASSFCLNGAVCRASTFDGIPRVSDRAINRREATREAIRRALAARGLPNGFSGITSFNDNEETEHADVLRLIDEAIELAGNEETP